MSKEKCPLVTKSYYILPPGESNAWDILNVTAMRRIMPNEEEYPNYAILTFEMVFARKVVFSTYILTLPCVFLAFLTLVVFWLPPDRPDRTALGKCPCKVEIQTIQLLK